ncbi:hypothetical protein HYC85_008143 [Camellia sinensis]|uniref:Plastocyanin-like domain-containing protein n=1 Tax=Camellia sinensis TaxID=4442 RepID=A0A7J7HSF4_CAMSI|nr:hypothetical protein HYC85_008143 [Camellia sinensis]
MQNNYSKQKCRTREPTEALKTELQNCRIAAQNNRTELQNRRHSSDQNCRTTPRPTEAFQPCIYSKPTEAFQGYLKTDSKQNSSKQISKTEQNQKISAVQETLISKMSSKISTLIRSATPAVLNQLKTELQNCRNPAAQCSPIEFIINQHEVKQPRNPWSDGPEYITQCAIEPGRNFTYEVIFSDEEGTLWCHAHSDWARNSIHGAIVIYPAPGTTYPFPMPDDEEIIILGSSSPPAAAASYSASSARPAVKLANQSRGDRNGFGPNPSGERWLIIPNTLHITVEFSNPIEILTPRE